ncbi:hypothetical protein [Aestuariivivens sediminis]|uniref:hypothetical protein n=1 Tax=Aestuariivivens sediminis TaxID=2913557 RepID=UPI001F58C70C|nr:hypothetical protein [Aestuariivivens sediminis]
MGLIIFSGYGQCRIPISPLKHYIEYVEIDEIYRIAGVLEANSCEYSTDIMKHY